MLVLTRKPGEAFNINPALAGRVSADQGEDRDGEIVVTVLAVEGDRVKLGITAPRHMTILRQELSEVVRAENRAAAITAQSSGPMASLVRGLLRKK